MSNNLPNLSTWHKASDGATVPAGTPVFEVDVVEASGHLFTTVRDLQIFADSIYEYYTEKPIPDPKETEVEARAERMYRAVHPALDDAWEYASPLERARWIELAKEYKPC